MAEASKKYMYAGYHLTPASFAENAIIVCERMKIRREDVIKLVLEYHLNNGGIEGSTVLNSTAKKAKKNLLSKGHLKSNSAYGIWDFCTTGDEIIYQAPVEREVFNLVYAYYFPAYQELAELKKDDRWPIKIGLTTTNIAQRISSQTSTAFPEAPVTAFEIECDDCYKLEKAIHSVLDHKNKRLTSALGKEWFLTNPKELGEILSFLGYEVKTPNSDTSIPTAADCHDEIASC
ncbi:GIY-YIG nuclease family protein [Serratia marcescens]|nr:GIY-YIG nuclease family protein [Serratia marcescens]